MVKVLFHETSVKPTRPNDAGGRIDKKVTHQTVQGHIAAYFSTFMTKTTPAKN